MTRLVTWAGATRVVRDMTAEEEVELAAILTPVPTEVRKLALVRACRATAWGESDLWTVAKAALDLADADTREDWDLAVEIPRDDPGFIGLATALATGAGMTVEQASDLIDDLFRAAAAL